MDKFLNLNATVKVKLTEQGIKWHYQHHVDFWEKVGRPAPYEYSPPPIKEDGYHYSQLWVVMETYGKYMMLGGELPFEEALIALPEKVLMDK